MLTKLIIKIQSESDNTTSVNEELSILTRMLVVQYGDSKKVWFSYTMKHPIQK